MIENGRQRVKEVFDAARRMAPGERGAFVRAECGADEALRSRVVELLADLDAAGEFLDAPTHGPPDAGAGVPERPGTLIGRYKLLEPIGEGGFGVVVLAEQREPVTRRVALKIIKLGMDTRQVIARFEAERQALALMDHPNIARVLDAGATDTGRPYFVMELVRGEPITRFCDAHRMPVRERLALFMDACHAVQHAHQKGIIHRDLKPSNVLVSRFDDKPVVKIIDFGIAKATGGAGAPGLTDKTLFTEFRQLIGTPAYMSPEQAGLSDLDIDTRSDIYALGVLLYELMTGTMPFDAARLRSAGFDEMRRIIREEEPPRPSTRMSRGARVSRKQGIEVSRCQGVEGEATDSGALDTSTPGHLDTSVLASCRRTDPRSLARSLHGDLDWIAMKALEKDRTRRYDTANGLAQDVERYLRHEPILAGPPSRLYRARRFIRRNRGMVTGGTLLAGALLAGLAGTTFGLVRAERRRAEAEAAREQTQKVSDFQAAMLSDLDAEAMGRIIKEGFREQVRAALERQHIGEPPDRRRRTPEEVEAKLAAFDERANAAHVADVARRLMDQLVLARGAEALDGQFGDQPLVEAQLHSAIGSAYQSLGLRAQAEPHLRAALEIRRRELGPDHELVGDIAWELAVLLGVPGRCEEALPLMRAAIDIHLRTCPGECAKLADGLFNMAHMTEFTGDLAEAERLSRESLAMRRRLVGDGDATVANGMNALARVVEKRGRADEAESLNREALAIARAAHGDEDPMNARILNDLGLAALGRDDPAAAEPLAREAVAIERRLTGDWDPLLPTMLLNHGIALERTGANAEAAQVYKDAIALRRRGAGDDNGEVVTGLTRLANVLRAQGDLPGAETCWREALAIRRRLHAASPNDPALAGALGALGRALVQGGKHAEAEPILRECLAVGEHAVPPDSPEYWHQANVRSMLGVAIAAQGAALIESDAPAAIQRLAEAEPLLLEAAGWLTRNAGYIPEAARTPRLREALGRVVRLYEIWDTVAPAGGKAEKAAEWRAELERLTGP